MASDMTQERARILRAFLADIAHAWEHGTAPSELVRHWSPEEYRAVRDTVRAALTPPPTDLDELRALVEREARRVWGKTGTPSGAYHALYLFIMSAAVEFGDTHAWKAALAALRAMPGCEETP